MLSPREFWELHRIHNLMKERQISNEEAIKMMEAEIEAGLCPYTIEGKDDDPGK